MDAKRICALDCGARCCREPGQVLLRDDESAALERLAQERNVELTLVEGLQGGRYLELPCPFLEGALCGIHQERPFACQSYPWRVTPGCRLSGWQKPPQVFLGVPRGGRHDNEWAESFQNVVVTLREAGMLIADPLFVYSCRVDNNRNEICQAFLRHLEAEYLLMLDDDMQFPPQVGVILAQLMQSQGLDILGGVYFQRGNDHYPHVYQYDEMKSDQYGEPAHRFRWDVTQDKLRELYAKVPELHEDKPALVSGFPLWKVDATGTGCMMIRRRVLEQTPYPWFRNEYGTGGDLAFCLKASRAGFKTHTATGIICTHNRPGTVGVRSFLGVS